MRGDVKVCGTQTKMYSSSLALHACVQIYITHTCTYEYTGTASDRYLGRCQAVQEEVDEAGRISRLRLPTRLPRDAPTADPSTRRITERDALALIQWVAGTARRATVTARQYTRWAVLTPRR
jgi:hypothetical protein